MDYATERSMLLSQTAPRGHTPLRVFIGYDPKEPVAYHVAAHSILTRASGPVTIAPLVQRALRDQGIYTRDRGPTESTEFSLTRFLVPFLSGYRGTSVFLDCDILCRTDLVGDLTLEWSRARFAAKTAHYDGPARPDPAVLCCQHDYTPGETVKFLGNPQTSYHRKNWSSVMVFDNAQCKALTPEYVNHATGLQLHRFQWLDDTDLAPLPLAYNWLVGEYAANPEAKILHYTLGGPWFPGFEHCDYADEWFAERNAMLGQAVAA